MTRKGVPKTTVDRIRELSREGKSANQIQRQLQREGKGIQRKTLLVYVRKFKGRKPKPQPYKYTPRKYRKRVAEVAVRKYRAKLERERVEHGVKQKHIAVYGKVRGISKRLEVSGTGKQLYSILFDAVEHPPKKRFLRTSASKLMTIHGRGEYLDMRESWDEKPTIKS